MTITIICDNIIDYQIGWHIRWIIGHQIHSYGFVLYTSFEIKPISFQVNIDSEITAVQPWKLISNDHWHTQWIWKPWTRTRLKANTVVYWSINHHQMKSWQWKMSNPHKKDEIRKDIYAFLNALSEIVGFPSEKKWGESSSFQFLPWWSLHTALTSSCFSKTLHYEGSGMQEWFGMLGVTIAKVKHFKIKVHEFRHRRTHYESRGDNIGVWIWWWVILHIFL